MKQGRLLRADDKSCIIRAGYRTTNFVDRMCGLLFRPPLNPDEALLITPCRSVHSIGMRYSIDLLFLDKEWKVVKAVSDLKPWRSASCGKARMVLEMLGGNIDNLQLSVGQQLEWQDESTR